MLMPLMLWTMQEHKYWEESFRVYEKGVALFKYPHVRDIWLAYLQHFVKRYEGTKLERARDLFRQALSQVGPLILPYMSLQALKKHCSLARRANAIALSGDCMSSNR